MVDLDRGDRGSAAVEDDDVGPALGRECRAGRNVRDEDRAGQPAPGPATADRRHAGERRDLEVVGRGMATRARELDELVERRRRLDDLRVSRAAATHRHHDDAAVAREEPCEMRCHGRLPHALARADHRDRGQLERLELRRVEPEVRADVGQSLGQRLRGPAEAAGRPEHGLVGEVDHHLGSREAVDERHAVVRVAAQLLGASDHDRADPLVRERLQRVTHHRRIVLPVDQRDRPQRRAVTSRSIRPVYFSYSPVTRSNWMILSCPWKGYRRQIAAWLPETSTTL